MIYLYDRAICEDLQRSFNPDNIDNPVVKVFDPDASIGLAAQIKNDEIALPIVTIKRNPETPIDTSRLNFTMLHKGVATVIDPETNELYYEKVLPITLSYELSVLTDNTVDMDEIIKELLFKYTDMYFLSIKIPYESKRKIRFGVIYDRASGISKKTGASDYVKSGKLYQSTIKLNCDGCVLITYTPCKLKHYDADAHIDVE